MLRCADDVILLMPMKSFRWPLQLSIRVIFAADGFKQNLVRHRLTHTGEKRVSQ